MIHNGQREDADRQVLMAVPEKNACYDWSRGQTHLTEGLT